MSVISSSSNSYGYRPDDRGNSITAASSLGSANDFTGSGIIEQTWTVPAQGTYAYTCTNTTCGTGNPGHTSMNGSFDVGQPSETDPGGKY